MCQPKGSRLKQSQIDLFVKKKVNSGRGGGTYARSIFWTSCLVGRRTAFYIKDVSTEGQEIIRNTRHGGEGWGTNDRLTTDSKSVRK